MRKIFSVFLVTIFLFSSIAYAQFKAPVISPLKGQSEDQQQIDYEEAHFIAVKKTGVDPDTLSFQVQMLQSQLSRDAMPGPADSLTLSPSQGMEAQETLDKINNLKKEYKSYLGAFSDEMESRGYKVK